MKKFTTISLIALTSVFLLGNVVAYASDKDHHTSTQANTQTYNQSIFWR